MKPIAILKKFFGLKDGQTIADFLHEVKELSGDERNELVDLAAIELGVQVDRS